MFECLLIQIHLRLTDREACNMFNYYANWVIVIFSMHNTFLFGHSCTKSTNVLVYSLCWDLAY